MDLRETILREHSKKNCDKIVSWVGEDQQKFDQLFNLFLMPNTVLHNELHGL